MATSISSNLIYKGKSSITQLAGKNGVDNVAHSAGDLWNAGGGAAGGIASGIGSVLLVGGAAGVSTLLTLMDYNNERDQLLHDYKHELQVQFDLGQKKPTRRDLEALAAGDPQRGVEANNVLADHLKKLRTERNMGIGLSIASSLIAMGTAKAVVAAVGLSAAGVTGIAALLPVAVAGAVGVAAYYTAKEPLHWIADKLYGVDKPSVHERIEKIISEHARGKPISEEQVFGVFAEAKPELGNAVKRAYGKSFDDLSADKQRAAVLTFSQGTAISDYTIGINSNRIKATELAFAVEGRASGVREGTAAKEKREENSFFSALSTLVHSAFGRNAGATATGAVILADAANQATPVIAAPPAFNFDNLYSIDPTPFVDPGNTSFGELYANKSKAAEHTPEALPANGFVNRLGLAPSAMKKGYADAHLERNAHGVREL